MQLSIRRQFREGLSTRRVLLAEKGVRVAIVRLPQVHDTRKQGLVTYLVDIARGKGISAYVGDGAIRWSACTTEGRGAPVCPGG